MGLEPLSAKPRRMRRRPRGEYCINQIYKIGGGSTNRTLLLTPFLIAQESIKLYRYQFSAPFSFLKKESQNSFRSGSLLTFRRHQVQSLKHAFVQLIQQPMPLDRENLTTLQTRSGHMHANANDNSPKYPYSTYSRVVEFICPTCHFIPSLVIKYHRRHGTWDSQA